MLGINHSTHRTSITFCHKLLVNKLLNLPYQETSAATDFSLRVTQPSQKFWSPPPPSPLPPLNLEKKRSGAVLCRILQTENNNECMQIQGCH